MSHPASSILLTGWVVVLGLAMTANAESVQISSTRTFAVPQFSAMEDVQIVLEGTLANSCYSLEKPAVQVSPALSRIDIQPRATLRTGACPETLVPWTQVVNLGVLPVGAYMVVVGITGQPRIIRVVPSADRQPNAPTLAPVDSVDVQVDFKTQKITATIRGRLPANCSGVERVNIDDHQQSIELTAILQSPCNTSSANLLTHVPYSKTVELPARAPGRYLVAIKSLEGQTLHRMFDMPMP